MAAGVMDARDEMVGAEERCDSEKEHENREGEDSFAAAQESCRHPCARIEVGAH